MKNKITNYSSVKECNTSVEPIVIEEFEYLRGIPGGDIFDPLVQKLIAKRCEDYDVNMLFELKKPDKKNIKYVVFTPKGVRLYFTSNCKKEADTMLRSKNIKTLQLENDYGEEYAVYLAGSFNDGYVFYTIRDVEDEQIYPCIDDVTIDSSEKITERLAGVLTDIESEELSLLDELKSDEETEICFNPKHADYLSELFLLSTKGKLQDVLLGGTWKDEDRNNDEDLEICFSALYVSNLIRGLESKKAYQVAADSLSFCLGKRIAPSELNSNLDSEDFNIDTFFEDYYYNQQDLLKWGLDYLEEACDCCYPEDAEACKKLLVGYNALYQLEGYSESDSRLFAISRLLSTKCFSEQLLLDCYKEVFGENGQDNKEINKVLSLYK